MIPPTIVTEANGLAEAWGKLIKKVLREGMILPTDYGPQSKDVCSVTTIYYPMYSLLLHPQFPTKEKHLVEYIKQFERGYDWKKQGFTYTYVDRITRYPYGEPPMGDKEYDYHMDQIQYLKVNLSHVGSRRAQVITWYPPEDCIGDEQPCLQRIWMRTLGDGRVEMHCMWRSRDLFAAWNSNYIALLGMIQREILIPMDLELVKLVDFCNSLHIYEADWDIAGTVQLIPVSPQEMRH